MLLSSFLKFGFVSPRIHSLQSPLHSQSGALGSGGLSQGAGPAWGGRELTLAWWPTTLFSQWGVTALSGSQGVCADRIFSRRPLACVKHLKSQGGDPRTPTPVQPRTAQREQMLLPRRRGIGYHQSHDPSVARVQGRLWGGSRKHVSRVGNKFRAGVKMSRIWAEATPRAKDFIGWVLANGVGKAVMFSFHN